MDQPLKDLQLDKEVDELLQKMKVGNTRITPQRRAVLKALVHLARKHPSVEDLYELVKKDHPRMSLATVYNNVRAFVNAGLVQELNFDEKTKHYDLSYLPHGHFVCESCGEIDDINLPSIDSLVNKARQLNNFRIDSVEVTFKGFCQTCLLKKTVNEKQ